VLLTAVIVVAAIGPLPASPLTAQEAAPNSQRGMTVDDLLDLEVVDDAAIDPSSSLVAIVKRRAPRAGEVLMEAGYYFGNVRGDVLIFSAATGELVARTNGQSERRGYWYPVWSPGGSYLAMLSLHGDTLKVCTWRRTTGSVACLPGTRAADLLTRLSVAITPVGVSGGAFGPFMWLSDSVLAFAALPSGRLDVTARSGHVMADSVAAGWARSARGLETSVSVLDSPREPFEAPMTATIGVWSVAQNTVRSVLDIPYIVRGSRDVVFSPDLHWAAVLADQYRSSTNLTEPLGFYTRTHKKVGIVAFLRDSTISWYPQLPYTRFVRWAPSGDRFGVMVKQPESQDSVGGTRLFIMNPEGRSVDSTHVDASADSLLRWVRVSSTDSPVPGRAHRRQEAMPLRISAARLGLDVQPSDHVLVLESHGRFAIIRRLSSAGTEILQLFPGGERPRRLLALNARLGAVAGGKRIMFSYTALDGSKQNAILLLPIRFRPGVRYPLITWVYPGDIFTDTLDRNMLRSVDDPDQAFLNPNILTGRGYAVLFPSMPMAAEGPGVAGEPYDHMLDGITPAIDTLIARGIADSTRLGIMGHSYGGYAVNCIVSQTHRFRAAYSSAGPADLTSFALQYAPSSRYTNLPAVWLPWAESGQGRMGQPPWRDPERYLRNSPLMHVDSVHTPILLSVGDNDDIGQEEEWFTALERAGKRARLLRYWGEGHWLFSPANTRHLWNEILQWFDTYLQPSESGAASVEPTRVP
jgi:dipeptidyl aminopeptidase/acylaminoacyl peptidase